MNQEIFSLLGFSFIIVERMIENGAPLGEGAIPKIVDFLAMLTKESSPL